MLGFATGRRLRAGLSAAALSVTCVAAPAVAETMTFGAYMAPKHPFYDRALEPLLEDLKADPDIDFKVRVIPGGQLLGARESLEGAKNRLADFSFVVPVYNRTELPEINLFFQFIAFGDNVVAGTGAVLEAMYLHCPQCLSNYTDNNTVPLATGSGGQYRMFCKDPANSVADLKGRKIRAVGALARLVNMMGGTPINMPANEGVSAIQRGTLDCLIGPLAWMTSYGYVDTAPNIVNVPMGYVKGLGLVVMNKDRWQGLSTEARAAMLSHMGELSARSTIDAYLKPDEELLSQADELGLKPTKGDGSFEELFKAFGEAEVAEVIAAAEASGVKNAAQLVETVMNLYPKWLEIAETTGNDPQKVGEAYTREVYSKLDPDTFGMN
ncbi:C4-dicarboxylate TRAP transporter substrate-binding protein [Antarcticimicrobium luteum]|nr:C4-dicarboxylate TRAP transporter substrate-binding protein [Antarcticimicrobium luteum]